MHSVSCTLIGLFNKLIHQISGRPTDFKVKPLDRSSQFVVKPFTGKLPATNVNSDIGSTLKVEFTPTQPGYTIETFHIYCNLDMEFDFFELPVCGIGSWNEKYKKPKLETHYKLDGPYAYLQKL